MWRWVWRWLWLRVWALPALLCQGPSIGGQAQDRASWLGIGWESVGAGTESVPSAGSCDAVIYCPPNKFMAAAQVEFCHDVSHVILYSFW